MTAPRPLPDTTPPAVGIARGGKAVYGAPRGILMLEARFPRIPGDMGNAGTWPFPVLYRVVRGASPERVVLQGARGLLPDFIAAAQELVELGAEAVKRVPEAVSAGPGPCAPALPSLKVQASWRPAGGAAAAWA